MRILHITDFHLDTRNLRDWNNFVKSAMLRKLLEDHAEKSFDVVAFTGDMIDKAGYDIGGAEKAFEVFKKEVIDPIAESLSIPIDRFLIIPGNHDMERDKDNQRSELGSLAFFKESKHVSDFISSENVKPTFDGIERMRTYKKFEDELYQNSAAISKKTFGYSARFKIEGTQVGVCAFNSSWRCYGKNDSGNLIVGEEQLASLYKTIKDCEVKVGLIHHPLDWLSDVERGTIAAHITKDFDLLLVGHVHESQTSIHTGFNGTLFISVAPSGLNDIRSDSRTFANGFTIIDFEKKNRTIECTYYRYNHSKKLFVLNTDLADSGRLALQIPIAQSAKKLSLVKTLIENIKEDHFERMDQHLLNVKAEVATTSIKEGFVLPPIDSGSSSEKDVGDEQLSIAEIVKSKQNLVVFGDQETGKTILLYRLVREFVDEFEYLKKVPVYVDFGELGAKELQTAIKDFLRCSSEDVKYLLSENQVVLLVDNVDFSNEKNTTEQLKKLHRFAKDNEAIQLIATSHDTLSGILPTDYVKNCRIPFRPYFIRSLKAREIKTIMKQWLPEESELQQDERLEKLVNSFSAYSLPSTAMSVSLFLWSMENKERKPINNAVLMEIYIEIILEKISKENVYRDNFDFTNKIQLLAKIAQEMLAANQPSYSILYSEFVSIIEKYLKELVGFQFDTEVIVKYFLSRKIFIKHQVNRVKFTYSCFFHFFIAKRMEYDPSFREYVMDKSHYFKFYKEIDYYTGLTRSDRNLFLEIFTRFEEEFSGTEHLLQNLDVDDYFSSKMPSQESVVKNVEIKDIKENRPSPEKLEEFYNQRLAQISNPSQILYKEGSVTLERLLILMANVLRNSEGVEDLELKKKAYRSIIKYSLSWMVLYREYLLDSFKNQQKLPSWVPSGLGVDYMLKNIPFHVQSGLYQHLGTSKLGSVVLEKIKHDNLKSNGVSDVESYLSIGMYSDIHATDFPKYLKSFIKRVKNNIVRDYCFYKLLDYYYRKTKPGSANEEIYLDILTELRIRAQGLPKRLKERVMKTFEDSKKTFRADFFDRD